MTQSAGSPPVRDHPSSGGSVLLAQAVVEAVPTPLLVLDADLRVLFANPAFFSTYRLVAEDVLGRSLFDVAQGQWDGPEFRALLQDIVPQGTEIRDFEIRATFADVGKRAMRITGRPVHFRGEDEPHVLLSVEDITKQVAYERKIRRYTKELERSNQDLERFAHAASHDLQEPLRKIRTYVDRIVTALGPDLGDARTSKYLSRMPEAVERLQLRINDLLQLARVGRGKSEREPTRLGEVVAATMADLEIAVGETGASVEVEELPEIVADPTQMRLLFQNLISNAVKFIEDGTSPTVRIRAEPVSGEEAGEEAVRIIVEDDGIGFDQEYAERIFTPFQRLHGRQLYDGSGVGLAICRSIVEGHGGTIEAQGRLGDGARFIITLPVGQLGEEEP